MSHLGPKAGVGADFDSFRLTTRSGHDLIGRAPRISWSWIYFPYSSCKTPCSES